MYESLKGKKLLVVGADMNDIAIVKAAKSMGVYTIAMDWSTDYKKSPAKLVADEAWDINYRDIERVADRCLAENVDGVMAGYSEMRVLIAAKISERIQKPFYATEEIMELTRDKRTFKELCVKYGVPVPKEYCVSGRPNDGDFANIDYPVIVKPADYGGRIGIAVCWNHKELKSAIEKALLVSEEKKIVVEEYVTGTEMCAIYNLSNGDIELALLNDKYQVQIGGNNTVLCNATTVPSKHLNSYMQSVDQPIKAFLRGIGAQNGMAFFQMIVGDYGIRVFEMGYRLNGGNDYHIIEEFNHINHMNMLISYSLTGDMGDDISKNNPCFDKTIITFLFYVHGGEVGTIEYEKLNEMPEVIAVTQKVFPGTVVVEDGTTRQEALVVKMYGNSMSDIIASVKKAQSRVRIEDKNGNDMLFVPFDTNRLVDDK